MIYTLCLPACKTVSSLFQPMTFRSRVMPESHATSSLVVWVLSDNKPGHLNQSLGLAEALARATPTAIHIVPALPSWRAVWALLLKRALGKTHPPPHLILGAGHATHLTLLAARRARGGRAVVLMKPSLPRSCFDLCILPQHDGVAADGRTLVTEGPLNRIRVSDARSPKHGLMLIGGTSPHFAWESAAIELQIKSILARTPDMSWTLTNSRRTPADFLEQLPAHPNLTLVPYAATPADWLPTQLARCGTVWVTPDSASMVFEALSAGANVGVLDLPVNPRSRVGWTLARLVDAQRVTRFMRWCASGTLHLNHHPLAEADRCARWILEWLKIKN